MTGFLTLSDLLGYCSIGCWLGAQFPQVLENIRRRSCAGLALPFLANWLLGDLSNLIGCILTRQLPFQTWLATYFVCVDFMLVTQYFYYEGLKPPPPASGYPKARITRRMSIDRGASRYRTLSAVAANVAAAAALAAQHDEQADAQRGHRRWHTSSQELIREGSGSRGHTSVQDEADEPDEDSLAALADSFHSEGGQNIGRKRVSWSNERHRGRGGSVGRYPGLPRSALHQPSLQITATEPTSDYLAALNRGRSLQRDIDLAIEPASADTHRGSISTSRRGASMVFLGVFALFSMGTLAGSQRGPPFASTTHMGQVISNTAFRIPVPSSVLPIHPPSSVMIDMPLLHVVESDDPPHHDLPHHDPPHHDPIPTKPSNERVLGRIFAWLCTTLYLTSRLPQIWKNFDRKSVEGLSVYLFIFAFLGNAFYVASILTSPNVSLPPPASSEFIRESIPYLMGSAGTLMFDITIVTQSWIYRPKPRRSRSRVIEEERGLLSGDAASHPPYSASESVVHSRGRTVSTIRTGI